MKRSAKALLRRLGYDVRPVRTRDLDLYLETLPVDAVNERRLYNIGAGSFRHPAWTNVDHESAWYGEAIGSALGISWDLLACEPIPLPDGRAEVVYSSHTVEHITDVAAMNLFREAHRILRPGGTLRITTPDVDLDYRAYRDGDRDFYRFWTDIYRDPERARRAMFNRPLTDASIGQLFLAHVAMSVSELHADGAPERIDDRTLAALLDERGLPGALDHCTSRCPLEIQKKYPGNHINWWNGEKLIGMLRTIGFGEVYRSGFGQSHLPVLRNTTFFDSTHPRISLYVEAIK